MEEKQETPLWYRGVELPVTEEWLERVCGNFSVEAKEAFDLTFSYERRDVSIEMTPEDEERMNELWSNLSRLEQSFVVWTRREVANIYQEAVK